MNDYDTKQIYCNKCKTPIGEIDYDAQIMMSTCGKCANPLPEGDNILYTASHFMNNPPKK